jgi:cytochrome P450
LFTVLAEADFPRADVSAEFGTMLFAAGSETVARLLGWAVSVLAEHPDQRAELRDDPSLVPNAVEELLRYEAPSPVQARWVTTPVELHGETVPADAKIVLLTGAAGRDERKFPEPDRFDIRRQFDHHVALGLGIHFCLGAALARMEGRVGVEETLDRFPEWEVDHDAARLLYTSTVRGYDSLPIFVQS